MEYQKRPGTSGIDGQFYETKLLALILFRLQHDRTVQYFHLATNIDDLGDFDDICLVVKIEGHDRPIAIFVQLKHKENDKAVIKFDNKDKLKYVTSFIKITKRIASQQPCDDFFDGNLNETDCLFILYTNAKFSITNSELKFEKSYATILNNLLSTSDTVGCPAQESDQILEDLEDHFLKNDLVLLSKYFVEFLIDRGNDRSMHIMNDECVQQYDVILSRKVFDISGIQTDKHKPDLKWRILTFQRDFFTTNEKYVLIFRNQLFKELLRKQWDKKSQESTTSRPSLDETISLFLTAPSVATLTPLILTHIDCNEVGKLEFLMKRPSCDIELLQQTHMSLNEIDEAILAVKTSAIKYLLSLELKVPIAFGNKDLAIRGSENKINRRLKFLTTAICGLCKDYEQQESYKIVTIGGHLDKALLDRNGGLASAVGNMLTYDEKTNMLKFSTNYTSEQNIAEQLFINLKNLIDDIFIYRFVVKTKKFPKLHFDCTDTAREFLSKLIIYEKQSNHWQVEEILKEKIEEWLIAESRSSIMKCTSISVFLHYHEEILKWWILPTKGKYLNKMTNLYEQAIYNMEVEPQISALQTMVYISRAKYFKTSFIEKAMKWTEQPELPSKLFITTDTVALTTVKILQCLGTYFLNNKFAVLDFEFILNLTIKDFDSLKAEMENTEKKLIIMWHRIQNNSDSNNIDDRLSTIALATKEKQLVIVINSEFKETIKEHFFSANDVFYDETESLSNLKSQKEITKHANVIFQGQKVTLDMILDDESVSFVKGAILDKVMRNETINIGEELSGVDYEEIKDFYVDRSVRHSKNNGNNNDDAWDEFDNVFTWNYNDDFSDNSSSSSDDSVFTGDEYNSKDDSDFANDSTVDDVVLNKFILLKTFFDIHSSVVLLTAPPGMGKSTLLTHLSLNTKEHDIKIWILRVNFRDYSKQFHEWYEDEIVVDALESLNLLCQVILRNDTISFDIEITDGEAHLVSSTNDESADFELNMFLHFYNQSRLIFVFDGFDEICPYYKDKVLSFLTIVKDDLRKYKMWVTSRPYSEILPDLETVLGRCFKIKSLSFTEQETYLRRFWNNKLLFKKPTDKQLKNLQTFLDNTRESISRTRKWVRRIYSVFLDTVTPLICQTTSNAEIDELKTILNSGRLMDSKRKINRLSGIPLLLYFLGDYFVNIVATDTKRSKTILDFNLHNVYELFIENKVKKVLFENKNKMDLSNTITRRLLEKELYDCISIHKKLAAYTFYRDLTIQKLDFEELKDMKPLNEQEWYNELDKIKTGSEKTGLISHVTTHNLPVFIHKSFTEYFIAEYICDIIKSDKFKLFQKVLWYCVITENRNTAVKDWMDRKKETDPTFRHALVEMKNITPIYKTKYHLFLKKENMSKRQYIRILASSVNDFEDECFSDYGEKFIMNYCDKFYFPIREELNEYFTNYCVSKMKPCLTQHFEGPILFKFRHTEVDFVRDFKLAKHNMDELDGVILKLKIKGHTRSVPLFMLLIHQDYYDIFQALNTDIMYKNCKNISNDNISQIDFVFIQFPRRLWNPGYDTGFYSKIKQFLATTSTIGNRLHYSGQHLNDFAEKMLEKEFILFASDLEMFLIQTDYISIEMMLNMYIKQYHVILRQHVFDITDIQRDENNISSEWRTVSFRNDFFYTNDRHIALLRNCLFKQMLNKRVRNISSQFLPNQLIPIFLAEPSVATLTPLFGSYIVGCEDNKLKFNIERPPSDIEQLRRINIPQSTIEEAMFAARIAAMIYLRSLQLKVSVDFGNIDLSRRDHLCFKSDSEYLKKAIVKLCQQSISHKVVTIDDTLDELLLEPSGGLGNCVGNILIYDEETEMLKVQHLDQFTPAQENAKSLYLQLSHEIDNLHEYRFRVKSFKLPKCHLDFDNFARKILRRLVIFAEQSNYYEIEEILIKGDKDRPGLTPYHTLVQIQLEKLHCHGEVLKWWRTSKIGECDINLCDLYQQAMNNIKTEPEISDLYTSFYLNNLKYFRYFFNENSTESMEVPVKHSKCIIITETVILTTIKVLRRLMCDRFNKEYTVLDLKHMLSKFSSMRNKTLLAELRNTKKVLIFVCTQISDDVTLDELAQLSKHKRLIIIANHEFRASVESHHEWSDVVFESEIESLSTLQSYKEIAKETKVIFQGQKVSLDVILDDKSVAYVKGDVLGKMINNHIVYIGRSISNAQYNKVKDSLIDKKVCPLRRDDDEHETSSVIKVLKTFYDIVDDVVLLTAPTGTGKSTLLTQLSLNTKELNWKLWIVRVNFTDHMEQFNKWEDENTPIDVLETLKFLCRVTLNNKITSFNVALTNNKAHPVNCVADELATFELNLFLHFYNEARVIFVFDAVDEIDPYCKDKVFKFLTVVRTRLLKSKMWVTSRSYSDILPDLQAVLGEGFKMAS